MSEIINDSAELARRFCRCYLSEEKPKMEPLCVPLLVMGTGKRLKVERKSMKLAEVGPGIGRWLKHNG